MVRKMPCENCQKVKDPERCFRTQKCEDWMEWFRAEWAEIRAVGLGLRLRCREETCVSCGAVIPEGRQICPACEKRGWNK